MRDLARSSAALVMLTAIALTGCRAGPKLPTDFPALVKVQMKCDTSNKSDNPPDVKVTYHLVLDKVASPQQTVTMTNDKEKALDVKWPVNAKPKKTIEWKVDKIERIDGQPICRCGCCVNAENTCKDTPTGWQKSGTIFDATKLGAPPDKLDVTVACTCQAR